MKNLEIEKKYLVRKENIPKKLSKYKHTKIEQVFIHFNPAIRARKMNKSYYFTVKCAPPKYFKSSNDLVRTEYEFSISKKIYDNLIMFRKGIKISKTRYFIPYVLEGKKYTIELDIFDKDFKGLIYAEVEFDSVKDANSFVPPDWFYKDVTGINKYKNTSLSVCKNIKNLLKY